MFCKFCGKEISENSQFCQYCGNNLNGEKQIFSSDVKGSLIEYSRKFADKFDINKVLIVFMSIFSILSIIVRFTMQKVTTVLYGIAYDDYYIISSNGRAWIIAFIIIQSVGLFLLYFLGVKFKKVMKITSFVISVFAIAIEIFLIFARFPAPY